MASGLVEMLLIIRSLVALAAIPFYLLVLWAVYKQRKELSSSYVALFISAAIADLGVLLFQWTVSYLPYYSEAWFHTLIGSQVRCRG